ncbi:MAG: CopG family transcriptional regulator [Actinomycetota bacterium]
MRRTTIMADEVTLNRLRGLARERGVSFAAVVREALEEKSREYRPKPKSLGTFDSGRTDLSEKAGVGRTPPRSWR